MPVGTRSADNALIVIPAFNEGATIARVVKDALQLAITCDVLVVDDGSRDDTADAARAQGAKVVSLIANLGYGNALRTGYFVAADKGYRAVVQLDGDGQHDVESIPSLLAPILTGEADVVVGSRFLGASAYPMPMARRIGQRLFYWVMCRLGGVGINDVTSGFQALGPRAIALYTSDAFPSDYPDANVLLLGALHGLRIVERPAVFHERSGGASMHRGALRPVYYVYKMLFSMVSVCLRYQLDRRGDCKREL